MILRIRNFLAKAFFVAIGLLTICGCGSDRSVQSATATPTQQAVPKFTASDLKKLRWIEGTWRGRGEGVQPFFERYRFEGDATLIVETFENEKLEKITDTTRYELKEGEFGGGNEGFRWIATTVDDKSISFSAVARTRNSFRWESLDENAWKATLNWPARADRPARERVYKMERVPAKQ